MARHCPRPPVHPASGCARHGFIASGLRSFAGMAAEQRTVKDLHFSAPRHAATEQSRGVPRLRFLSDTRSRISLLAARHTRHHQTQDRRPRGSRGKTRCPTRCLPQRIATSRSRPRSHGLPEHGRALVDLKDQPPQATSPSSKIEILSAGNFSTGRIEGHIMKLPRRQFLHLQRALPRSRPSRASQGHRLIRRGPCACSLGSPPAVWPMCSRALPVRSCQINLVNQ
jgi:hypothetical protein